MFNRCDFLLGKDGQSILIVIPAHLPEAETYTISVCSDKIKFKADHQSLTELAYQGGEIFERISRQVQVGLVEFPPGGERPDHITNVAYVEVRRAER